MKSFLSRHWIIIFVLAITSISLLMRLYQLDRVYSILNRDEAALAYNALLLKTTGHDEWGQPLRVTLLSFGDWKLIGYPLILILFYHLLPLSDSLIRLPSVLAGTILIPLTFYLVLNLTQSKLKSTLATVFIATTPVFFFYSRIAYEANLALTLIIGAVYLIFLNNLGRFQAVKMLLIAACLLYAGITYNTPIFVIPIIIVGYILYRGIANYRDWIKVVLTLSLVFGVLVYLTQPVLFNKTGITIFSDETTKLERNNYYTNFPLPGRFILGNQYVFYAKTIAINLTKSFSTKFLVVQGGSHPWHQLPGWGLISPISYIFMILYIFKMLTRLNSKSLIKSLFKTGVGRFNALSIIAILSLLPSAITIDTPHVTRSLVFIYLIVVLGIATYSFSELLTQLRTKVFLGILVTFQLLYFGWYLNEYFLLDARLIGELRPGFGQVITKPFLHGGDEVAIVADGYQYILLAWYLKLSPDYYLTHNQRALPSSYGLRYGERVGQFHFIADKRDRSKSEKYLIWYDSHAKTWRVE